MANPTHKTLEQLNEALLSEETEEVSAPVIAAPDRVDIYNSDSTDLSPQDLSDALLAPKKRSLTGILVVVLFLKIAILAAIIWYLQGRYLP